MAKTGQEPAGTSGSQFFVVTGDDAAQLTPDYALLGEVTSGQEVVDKIGAIQADAQRHARRPGRHEVGHRQRGVTPSRSRSVRLRSGPPA